MVRLAVLLLVVIDVVGKEECAGLDGALSFTYYGKRNPYPGSTSIVFSKDIQTVGLNSFVFSQRFCS